MNNYHNRIVRDPMIGQMLPVLMRAEFLRRIMLPRKRNWFSRLLRLK